ncbi:hypothetical protein SY83_17620 [Paenibacillus swuensis]|uniref:Uncharacterized protein n=1 Tax=Paenibacillus swuensis TaxID=1178515 RepID=A0A172TLL9_9BACL|nr:hypothetical protein [Paenibacillus swuensis]ANE47804.1 hypothetical protein SY83_17620 [Paenibacillus swuensis]
MSNSLKSLTALNKVKGDEITARVISVQTLAESEYEFYEIDKDTETGEHYLHFAYLHKEASSAFTEEFYHQLMPLGHDDVIAVVMGEQLYTYPVYWNRTFLRNGPEGHYVWFNPAGTEDRSGLERSGLEAQQRLHAFKLRGDTDPESVEKLMRELDKLWEAGDQ